MNFRLLAKYWRTVLVLAEMNLRQQMTDGFILFTIKCAPNFGKTLLTYMLHAIMHIKSLEKSSILLILYGF